MKITQAGFMHAKYDTWERRFIYQWWPNEDMASCGYVMVCPHEITFDLPDQAELHQKEITLMREEQQRIRAEAQSKVARLDECIAQLLAIEHKPERGDGS